MRLSFNPNRGLIVVPVRLTGAGGDLRVNLALDTGATTTLISREAAQFLGHALGSGAEYVEIVTGSTVEKASRAVVASLDALGIVRRDFPVVCHSLPSGAAVDGVLGLDFIRGRILIVDMVAGSVEITLPNT